VPTECGWSDVGSWCSLYEVRKNKDERGNCKQGDVLAIDCESSFFLARGKRTAATLWLRKILVIGTDDAVLVANLERSQEVRKITDFIKKEGLGHLL